MNFDAITYRMGYMLGDLPMDGLESNRGKYVDIGGYIKSNVLPAPTTHPRVEIDVASRAVRDQLRASFQWSPEEMDWDAWEVEVDRVHTLKLPPGYYSPPEFPCREYVFQHRDHPLARVKIIDVFDTEDPWDSDFVIFAQNKDGHHLILICEGLHVYIMTKDVELAHSHGEYGNEDGLNLQDNNVISCIESTLNAFLAMFCDDDEAEESEEPEELGELENVAEGGRDDGEEDEGAEESKEDELLLC